MFSLFRKKSKKKQEVSDSRNVNLPDNSAVSNILDKIRDHKSYYAGGSLCVDNIVENDVLVMNLSGDYFLFSGDKKGVLNESNVKKLFGIYLEVKGDNDYYREQLKIHESK